MRFLDIAALASALALAAPALAQDNSGVLLHAEQGEAYGSVLRVGTCKAILAWSFEDEGFRKSRYLASESSWSGRCVNGVINGPGTLVVCSGKKVRIGLPDVWDDWEDSCWEFRGTAVNGLLQGKGTVRDGDSGGGEEPAQFYGDGEPATFRDGCWVSDEPNPGCDVALLRRLQAQVLGGS